MCAQWDLNDNLGFEHEQGLPARTSAGGLRPATPDRVAGDRDGQRRFDRRASAQLPFPGRNLTMPTSTVTRTPEQAQSKPQPSEDEREQARRALQTSMDTRQ
jgi:hypothetical protein